MAMNEVDKKKIKRNLAAIKERIHDLGPIIDRLIQMDIFTIEVKNEIETVQPSTRQDKFDRFIRLLCRRGPNAYRYFLNALNETGHEYLVGILETDNARQMTCAADGDDVRMKQQELTEMITNVVETVIQKSNKELISKMDQTVIDVRNEYDEKATALQKQLRRLEDTEKEYDRLRNLQGKLREDLMKKDDRIKRLHKTNADAQLQAMQLKEEKDADIDELKQEMKKMQDLFKSIYATLKREIEEEKQKFRPNDLHSWRRKYTEMLENMDSIADRLKKAVHVPTLPETTVLPPITHGKVPGDSARQMSTKKPHWRHK